MSIESGSSSGEIEEEVTLQQLSMRLEAQSSRLERLEEKEFEYQDLIEELREQIAAKDNEIEKLQSGIEGLHARTDLLALVERSDEASGRQLTIAIIQHLKKAAERERDRGNSAAASLNRDEADAVLQYPDIDRTTIYRYFEKAEKLVGNKDVLWYDSGSGGDSRLRLDLEKGELPKSVTGRSIRGDL